MKRIAKLPDTDRWELFRNTADKMGLQDAIVEKDFWVCFTLDYLFHRSPLKDSIVFKGGTSLSKAFDLITRFSEDIDLILDWRVLGYGLNEPWAERSKTKQDAFNKETVIRTSNFLKNALIPQLQRDLSDELGRPAEVFLEGENSDPVVIFAYPNLFGVGPALPVIRLEIGPLAAWTPAQEATITSYAAEHYPNVFAQRNTSVLTVAPTRSFWEKATILHHEAHRPEESPMPSRYSRHYYDLYRMAQTPVKDIALRNTELLQKVVLFKMKFYPRAWAKYDEAIPGTFRLVPPAIRLNELAKDYATMKEMIFGEIPSFSEIMSGIADLEAEINRS